MNSLLVKARRSQKASFIMYLCTLHPFETLLSSGLPMMIWQKSLQRLFSFYSMVIQKKKLVKWQKFKTALCDLTEKLLLFHFVSMQFWTEILQKSSNKFFCQIIMGSLLNSNVSEGRSVNYVPKMSEIYPHWSSGIVLRDFAKTTFEIFEPFNYWLM